MIKLISPALRRQFAGTGGFLSPRLLSVLLVVLTVCAAAASSLGQSEPQENISAAAGGEVRTLAPGEVITQNIKGSEAHVFRLALAAGQYVHVVVEQRDVNVVLKLSCPGVRVPVEVDSPNGRRGPEAVSTVAELAGSYKLEISANKTQLAGSYELRVEGPRESTPADEKRVAAERAYMAAQNLEEGDAADALTRAIEQYQKALALWREVGDARGEGYTLTSIGLAYKSLGKLKETSDYLNQAVARLADAQDAPGQAFALNELGAAQRNLGDPLLALGNYDRALDLRRSIGDQWGQAQLYNNIGLVYSNIGQQRRAIENLELALPLYRAAGDRQMELNALNNIAKAQWEMGDLTDAFEQFKQLSKSCDETADCQLKPYIENGLGLIHDTWSEPQEALVNYDSALSLFREANNKAGLATVLDNIGMVYAALDDAQEARNYFQQALKLRQELNEPRGEAVTRSNLGYAEMLLGNYQEALNHLNLAMALAQKSRNRSFEAYTLARLGLVSAAQGETAKALDYYQRALAIQEEIKDRRGQAITLDQIGQLSASAGRPAQEARRNYDEALRNWKAVGDRQGETIALYGIARIERDQGKLAAARDRVEEAIGIVESLRSKMTSHQLRMTYLAGRQDLYALAVDIRMRLYEQTRSGDDLEAALFASERARARGLLDLLTEAHAGLNRGMSPQQAERNRRLEQEIAALTENWLRLRNLERKEDAAAAEEKLDARVLEREKLLAKVRAADPSYAALSRPPLQPREIQQLLDDDTLLLEYSLDESRSYLWAVTRTEVVPYTLPGRAEIEKTAGRLRQALTAYEPPRPGESALQYLERRKKAAVEYRQLALDLSRMVLGPVSSRLGGRRLVIVAAGGLQYIPFEALPAPDSARYLPLISKHEIIYQPSATTLALLRNNKHRPASKTVAVIADPVFDSDDDRVRASARGRPAAPNTSLSSVELGRALRDIGDAGPDGGGFKLRRLRYTAAEAEAIVAAAPGSSMKAVDFKASRATVTGQDLGQYSVVHFATHGILNERHPELSGIVLSMVNEQGQPEDGYLRLGDIYNLDLPVDLVVLSACRTAVGRQVRGEGLVGLTRGFMYAGASRVVASLWKVEDEATAELMKRFYKYMLEKKLPAAAALRQAKIDVSESARWRAPFFWAGFVIQGDWK
jgi:CHAT domain-containing protein/tetratricopeptide (TPR) repeat protein